jgi:hypothetical protein
LAEVPEFDFEDVLVEEYDGVERLILRGSSDVSFHGEVAQKGMHFVGTHVPGVPLSMKEDVAADPLQIGFFGPQAIVFHPQVIANLVEKLWRGLGRVRELIGRLSPFGW